MPSPFPGMNPYIEHPSIWQDFHGSFIPIVRQALIKQVVPRYFVKMDAHLYVHQLTDETRFLMGRSDLSVTLLPPAEEAQGGDTGLLIAPAEVTVPEFETESVSYLEIVDRDSLEVVTVVELLSRSNKLAGSDRDQYISKARQLIASNVNLVEIDLLRCGLRTHWIGMPRCDYSVVISRPENTPKAGLWPIQLRDRLPVIPVPLRSGDADARLDLQQLLHLLYDTAGYEYFIYRKSPDPALSPEDAEWAKSLIP